MSTAATALADRFEIAGHAFHSRIIIGTGKYRSYDEMKAAHRSSGAEMVTIAVRRVPLDRSSESFLDHLGSVAETPAEHRRLLFSGRSRAHGAPGARSPRRRNGSSWK